ncbi:heat shock protein [Blastocystis sp. ATCC 50177/Nand II]|uniref:Heat shock protein n=1 Tax=Blastocystis sp. subtype 1 (strain ATCC 50177 / NandII) TaxID=478820 RepID=A0A196SE47_BLAHN|nr:heat shock protein [Blastocystis sp. ATCC 50177/Nand II]
MVFGTAAERKKGVPNCLYEFKRILGLNYNNPLTQLYKEGWPFKVEDVDGDDIPRFIVDLTTGRAEFTAGDMYAVFIGYFKELAERKAGHEITHVVLTVPAHFNDIQRLQVKEAAESCGLTVIQLMNEPTAAVLAYSVDNDINHQKVLVYDLGGGTFDVTVMNIDNKYEVLSSTGDIHLDAIREQMGADYQINEKQKKKLMKCAEKAKCELSTTMINADVDVSEIVDGTCFVNISLAMFQKAIEPELQRALSTVTEALEAAKLGKEDINSVILIGGSSYIPRIKSDMEAFFPNAKLLESINRHTAVAQGALYYAAIKTGTVTSAKLFPEMVSEEVAAGYVHNLEDQASVTTDPLDTDIFISIGLVADHYVLEQANDSVYILITAGRPFGAKKELQLETMTDYQEEISIRIAQGNNPHFSQNKYYCHLSIKDIPALPKGEVKVTLSMKVNESGYVNFSAITDEGQPAEIEMKNPLLKSAETIKRNLEKIKKLLEENKIKAALRGYNKELEKAKKSLEKQGGVMPAWLEEEREWAQQPHSVEEYKARCESLVERMKNLPPVTTPTSIPLPPPLYGDIPPLPLGGDIPQDPFFPPPPPAPVNTPLDPIPQDPFFPPPPPTPENTPLDPTPLDNPIPPPPPPPAPSARILDIPFPHSDTSMIPPPPPPMI